VEGVWQVHGDPVRDERGQGWGRWRDRDGLRSLPGALAFSGGTECALSVRRDQDRLPHSGRDLPVDPREVPRYATVAPEAALSQGAGHHHEEDGE